MAAAPQQADEETRHASRRPREGIPAVTSRLLDIEGRRLVLTDVESPAWSGAPLSRADLLAYYLEVADLLLPFLQERPASVARRTDEGLDTWTFDRRPGRALPVWIARCQTREEGSLSVIEGLVVDSRAALAALVNAGCVSFHPWSSNCHALDRPDQMLFDVDPTEIAFREVRSAAMLLRELLARYGIRSWVKTSGGGGVHVMVPLHARYSFAEVHAAAALIARVARTREPKLFSFEVRRSRRRGRILVDIERNRMGVALMSPWSVRPDSGLISAPVEWSRLERPLYPEDFPMEASRGRLDELGAPLRDFFAQPQSLQTLLDAANGRRRRSAM